MRDLPETPSCQPGPLIEGPEASSGTDPARLRPTSADGPEEVPTVLHGRGPGGIQAALSEEGPPPDDRDGFLFAPGQIVAGRYRISSFLARGGMGAVYAAEDLELGERVALKTVLPHGANDELAMERFKREIQLARKVTHPNACRIFELGAHEIPGVPGRILFLTMELLEGETLSKHLRRHGRMSEAEALPLLRQMAAALDAAHEAGVVHLDFKSANVMLVPAGGRRQAAGGSRPHAGGAPADAQAPSASALRAVVTDFGLARSLFEETDPHTGGHLAGTPAYMAPEQVEGKEASATADVYALGMVLYEMVTGRVAFQSETPRLTAVRRLHERPDPPRTYAPGLDPVWELAILRCLEREPAGRFASAGELVRTLQPDAASSVSLPSLPQLQPPRPRRWRLVAAAAALAILGAGLFWAAAHQRSLPRLPAGPAAVAQRSVAVLGFQNLSGRPEAAWLSTALAQMLGAELAAGERLRTVPGESVARMKLELQLVDAESYAADTLQRIGRNLGTDYVVLGSYVALGESAGGQMRFVMTLQDTRSGETLASVSATGAESELFELISWTGAELRTRLGLGRVTAVEAEQVRAALPADPEAARLYSEGLMRLRLFETREALLRLSRAAERAPDHPLVHSALAMALWKLGNESKAREAARRAFDLAGALSREDKLLVEARYHETAEHWDEAGKLYRTLFSFFPENVDYGVGLSRMLRHAGQAQEALAVVEELRRQPALVAQDPRVDLEEASATYWLSDYARSLRAATDAAERAEAREARLMLAEARQAQGKALQFQGELVAAAAAFDEAKALYAAAGDRLSAASSASGLGDLLYLQGDLAGAKRLYDEHLGLSRATGCNSCVASAQVSIGSVLEAEGDLTAARLALGEALELRLGSDDAWDVARIRLNVASVAALQGSLDEAERLAQQAMLSFEEGSYEQADALMLLGDCLRARGEIAAARGHYEKAKALWQRLDERRPLAHCRLALAHLSLDEEAYETAEALVRQTLEGLAKEEVADEEGSVQAVLARALLGQGRHAEAREAAELAVLLIGESQDLSLRLGAAADLSRVRAASGQAADVEAALQELASSLEAATRSGFVLEALEMRLAMGQIERQAGRGGAAERLAALALEARGLGFGRIARLAEAAAR
jgi:eukaryotic-like serine/threonine-protein kinase